MLIPFPYIVPILNKLNIKIKGIIHVGAHECEELTSYVETFKIEPENIIWLDALEEKVENNKARNIPNQYHIVVSDKDNEDINFHVANNGHSSSILEFGTHLIEHPAVHFIEDRPMKTTTLKTFIEKNNIDIKQHNFWNLDIQGAEMLAFKGADNYLDSVDVIYLEINKKELYKKCALFEELNTFLESKGFQCFLENITGAGWGDAVYCRISPKLV